MASEKNNITKVVAVGLEAHTGLSDRPRPVPLKDSPLMIIRLLRTAQNPVSWKKKERDLVSVC